MKNTSIILMGIMLLLATFGPSATLALPAFEQVKPPVLNESPKPVVNFNPFAPKPTIKIDQSAPSQPMNNETKDDNNVSDQPADNTQIIQNQPAKGYQFMPKQYLELKEKQNESREQIVEAIKKQTDERQEENNQVFILNTGEFLLRTIAMIVKQLEILRDRIAIEEIAKSSEFAQSLNLIDSDISWLKQTADKISSVKDDPAAIRKLAEEFRNFWREHRFDSRLIAGRLMAHKMEKLFAKTNNLEVELGKQIEILKLRGVDVTALENLMTDYRKKINEANGKLDQAQKVLTNSNQTDDLADNGQNKLMREAGVQMAEARKIMVRIINELKKRANIE
jgi:hypothetical protein